MDAERGQRVAEIHDSHLVSEKDPFMDYQQSILVVCADSKLTRRYFEEMERTGHLARGGPPRISPVCAGGHSARRFGGRAA